MQAWVHGIPARNMQHLEGYLTGDAHDQSKAQLFDGERFKNVDELPSGTYGIETKDGATGTLIIESLNGHPLYTVV